MHYEFGPEMRAECNITVQLGHHPRATKALVRLFNDEFEFFGTGVCLMEPKPTPEQVVVSEQTALVTGIKAALDDYMEWLAVGIADPDDDDLVAIEDEVRDIFERAGLVETAIA